LLCGKIDSTQSPHRFKAWEVEIKKVQKFTCWMFYFQVNEKGDGLSGGV